MPSWVATADREVGVARKGGGGLALYVALLVAVVILVPPVRQAFLDLIAPLLGALRDLNPLRA
ncbi:hypothetical protein KZQ38_24235 [Saccharothrix sp. SC076]|nr:hypothetical protein [Saccharothrix obliqua]